MAAIAVAVQFGDKLYYTEFDSGKAIRIGETEVDLPIPGFDWSITASCAGSAVDVSVSKGTYSSQIRIKHGESASIDEVRRIAIVFNPVSSYPQAYQLPRYGEVNVGSSDKLYKGILNDVVIKLPLISRNHFSIECKDGECTIADKNSTNGTFVNGQKVISAKLKDGDVISIFTTCAVYRNQTLHFCNVGNSMSYVKTYFYHDYKAAPLAIQNDNDHSFSRAPRLLSRIEKRTINIEKPPQSVGKPQFNWLSILLTPMISVALMLVLVLALGMSPIMLIMSGVMSVVSAVVAVFTYRKQKKEHLNKDTQIDTKYHDYLAKVSKQLTQEHESEIKALLNANPSPEQCLSIAVNRSRQLWERRPVDDDFLSVRVGLGTIDASVSASFQQAQVVLEENELENEAKKIADNSKTIPNAPIICDLLSNKQAGVIGSRVDELALIRNFVVELATTHSYDELKIVALVPEKESDQWDWMRWLPHCMDDRRSKRFLFTSLEDADEALSEIDDVLNRRKNESGEWGGIDPLSNVPHYLFIVATTSWIEKHSIRKHFLTSNEIGCSTLFVGSRLNMLPKECDLILDIGGATGTMYNKSNAAIKTAFAVDSFTIEKADQFARSLAPVYTETEMASGSLPTGISFLKGYDVTSPDQLRLKERWANAKTYKSLSVPIAASYGGNIFEFDIHEKKHGVNGIVAGMPGSGKTEMVQSWLLSLAVNFSPQDVSFVLIDFKGTGMIAPFRNLPHLAGSISNLDKNISRNLIAIQSEVHRREAIIDKYSNQSVKNVNDLNKSFVQGLVPEKLPILLIVIDEFAEFKKNFPDFGAEIDSLTSKGRALGIFVVLMTQKPTGVVSSKSEDNIKFRWCLRVANYSASREMLGKPDAAKISNPGRAFIKVGEDDVYEEVQSFWSGAPYDPSQNQDIKPFVPISKVKLNGKRVPCETRESKNRSESNEAEIDAVVRYIIDYCTKNKIPWAEKVWTEQLPERITLPDVLDMRFDGSKWPETERTAPVIGIVDDPAAQEQRPLSLDFASLGHTIVFGAPVTGKTTLLQTLVMSIASTRKPDEASIYIMDFGGWNMNVLAGIPHVGGIANDNNPDRLKKLTVLVNDILNERMEKFSGVGVGNIGAYRETLREKNSSIKIPDVFVLVDNFGAMIKMYPDFDSFFVNLSSKGANYGIYLVVTAGTTNAIPMKISQNIKSAVALQLIEKSDYTYTVGKVSAVLPAVMGRGYIKGNPPLEFQTALPAQGETDKQISDNIRRTADGMTQAWDGELPDMIPEMPGVIPYGSVRTDGIAIGLSSDKIRPLIYDWRKQHYLLISGASRSGKSNMLSLVSRQMKSKLGGRVIVMDPKKKLRRSVEGFADNYLTDAADFDKMFTTIRPELQKRYEMYQQNNSSTFEPIIIAIDDYGEFYSAISNETASRLLPIVKIGTGLAVYLIVAGDAYDLTNHYNKGVPVTQALARGQQVIILGGCIGDHGCCSSLQMKTSITQKSVPMDANCGLAIFGNDSIPFKAMKDLEKLS